MIQQQPARRFLAYVVFSPSSRKSFWDFFTDPAFRHCWVILPAPLGEPGLMTTDYSVKVEPLLWGVDVAVWWADPLTVAKQMYEDGATAIVEVGVYTPPNPGFVPRGFLTCVTMVKAIIAVRNWRIWTPRQLFRYLVARQGGRILPVGDGGNGQSGREAIWRVEAERP